MSCTALTVGTERSAGIHESSKHVMSPAENPRVRMP